MRRSRRSAPPGSRPEGCSLPPLRWVAQDDLLYDPATNTLHRPDCRHASELTSTRSLAAHQALELVWAPLLCDCRPDVTLALGGEAG